MSESKSVCVNCIEKDTTIFHVLSPKEKEFLLINHVCAQYKKGEMIYTEGDKPAGLLCLVDGKIKIFKEGAGGREQIIRMAKPVNFIGYRALFAEDNYNSSSLAIEDSIVCILNKKQVFKLIRSNPEFAMVVIKYMAIELGFANSRTVNLTQKHIRGRLAESLLFLKDTYGLAEDNSTIKVYLSRDDLASLSSMTTSNAIRTLWSFAEEKLISIDGRKIKIIDLKKLERISEIG